MAKGGIAINADKQAAQQNSTFVLDIIPPVALAIARRERLRQELDRLYREEAFLAQDKPAAGQPFYEYYYRQQADDLVAGYCHKAAGLLLAVDQARDNRGRALELATALLQTGWPDIAAHLRSSGSLVPFDSFWHSSQALSQPPAAATDQKLMPAGITRDNFCVFLYFANLLHKKIKNDTALFELIFTSCAKEELYFRTKFTISH